MFVAQTCGISCLCAMVYLQRTHLAAVVISLYLIRTALQNATYPLSESILMDYVPKKSRARWKSLESVVQFGWCGSAVLGGWFGDR